MLFIKYVFALLIFALALGAFCSIFVFIFDVIKWHDREEKFVPVPSKVSESINESEVKSDVDESDEHNTSAFSFLGG